MSRQRGRWLLAWLLLLGAARGQEGPVLLAGVAEGEVTPAVGVPLAGYGGRLRKEGPELDPRTPATLFRASTGVRDPIEAQALWLEQGGPGLALVTLDAIGVEQALVEDVRRAAAKRGVPLGPGRLLMAASHTHSGPGALSRRWLWEVAATDVFQPRVHAELVERLAELLRRAWTERAPARLGDTAAPVAGVSRNRRASRSRLVGEDDVDPTLGVLRVEDLSGRARAVLLHYAVHPTCLGDENLRFSADVAGEARREAARRLGCPVLFLNGAEGDVAPRPGGEAGIERVGRRLGEAAAELAGAVTTRPAPGLTLLATERDLGPLVLHPGLGDGEAEGWAARGLEVLRRLPLRLREPLVDTRFRFAALRLGDLVLLFTPGEPIAALGTRWRARALAAGFPRAWVVGLANGHMGYLTTPAEYREGGYEAWLTFYGEHTADRVEEAFAALLERLAPR